LNEYTDNKEEREDIAEYQQGKGFKKLSREKNHSYLRDGGVPPRDGGGHLRVNVVHQALLFLLVLVATAAAATAAAALGVLVALGAARGPAAAAACVEWRCGWGRKG
jgi:hypothetical protein